MKRSLTHLFGSLALCLSLGACSSFTVLTHDGPIEEDFGRRTQGSIAEDNEITDKVRINSRFDSRINEDANLQVKSFNKIVLLTGQVANSNAKLAAGDIARAVRNVRSVHNQLEIGQAVGFGQRSKDRLLATKIRTRLLAADDIESSRVEFVVENSAVYFMGLVTRAEALRIIEAAQQAAGIKKIVKVFEYIDNKGKDLQ